MSQRRTITPAFTMVYKPRFGFAATTNAGCKNVNIACRRPAGADWQLTIADCRLVENGKQFKTIGNRQSGIGNNKMPCAHIHIRRNAAQFKDFLTRRTLWMCDSVKPPEARNDKDFAWSNDC